jgi:hypothetical protein
MLQSQTLESFIDRTLTQYVPGAFLSGQLATCAMTSPDDGAFDGDFVDPSDVFDDDGRGPANDADTVADNIRSIYRDSDWPPPAAAA